MTLLPIKRRTLYLFVMLVLLVVLGGVLYAYLILLRPAAEVQAREVSPGLKHIRTIYAYGAGAQNLLSQPFGVAFHEGRLYVGQQGKGSVVVFDEDGKALGSMGSKGDGPGRFTSPGGIDVDDSGRVYVADAQAGKVVVFEPDGTLVRELAMPTPLVPLAYDNTRLYVACIDGIRLFSLPDFAPLGSWGGTRGRGEDDYDFPNGLAAAPDGGAFFVADSNNTRVKRLDANGENVWVVGRPSADLQDRERLFGLPSGLALVEGVLYLADPLNGTIHLYDTGGTIIGEAGEPGQQEGQFGFPSQIAWMGGKRFAISEWGNDRVQIVEIDPEGVASGAR